MLNLEAKAPAGRTTRLLPLNRPGGETPRGGAMSKTILLAVDTSSHVSAAAAMTRELSRDNGYTVVVLHVHEFATGRWGRMQVDCQGGAGEKVVSEIVAGLKAAGV